MQTVEIKVFEFDELEENVRQRIVNHWRDDDSFFWSEDWINSLNAFADYFDIEIKNYSVGDYSHNFVRFRFRDDDWDYNPDCANSHTRSDTQGVRLFKMLNNRYYVSDVLSKDCPFTGYCGDEDLLRPIREFMKKPDNRKTFYELIDDCFDEWLNGFQSDYEHWLSDDCIAEEIAANGYKFLENGETFQ